MGRSFSKSINDMHKAAALKKGKCLSKNYSGMHGRLKWQCEFGHVWKTAPNGIIYSNTWCPACADIRFGKRSALKDGFQKMNSLATSKGGKCLSKRYVNAVLKLKWQCEFGHTWEASYGNVKSATWCPVCKNITIGKKLTLKDGFQKMNSLATSKGGKCLSKHYVSVTTKYKWECSKGHTWEAIYDSVRRGSWCPTCGGTVKLTIEKMQKVAELRGGECLSKTYMNAISKLKWQCSKGHIWFSTAMNVIGNKSKTGTWCPKCAGKAKLTIEEMQQVARDRGGKCLSKKYTDNHTKLEWQCSEGHTWRSSPNSIIHSKTWCPKCSGFFKEELCRTTFEQIFETKFLKHKPKWLISSAKGPMELDGYSKKYNMAFEYNGEQHFKKGYWIPSEDLLKRRIIDDRLKEELCAKKGITLIVITYKNDLIKLPAFIKSQLKLKNLNFSNINFEKEIDFNKAYKHKPKIQKMREVAKARNGICLSDKYVDSGTKLKWQCTKGHIWFASAENIIGNRSKTGTWCAKCAGTAKLTIEQMQGIAKKRGGICLSKEYVGALSKLKWQCSMGHIWKTAPSYIVNQNSWCPKCAGRAPLILEDMNNIAKDRGGKCLSKNKKFGAHTKLKWQCTKDHIWLATPSSIMHRKSWCPECAGRRKKELN